MAKTYDTILTSLLSDLTQKTSINKLSAGGKARALYEATSKGFSELYSDFDNKLLGAFLSSSSGSGMEFIGAIVGCYREPASTAAASEDLQIQKFYVSTGTFGSINGGLDINISSGIAISTQADSGGTVYYTTGSITLSAFDSVAYVGTRAAIPGGDSNVGAGSLNYHNFTSYTDYLNQSLLTTNVHGIVTGRDVESDTNFKYRISKKVVFSATGNETALRIAALLVPGVSDVIIKRNKYGIGTTSLILQSTLPVVSSALVASVSTAIGKVASLGDLIFVSGPDETGISMEFTIEYQKSLSTTDMSEIEFQIQELVQTYINGLNIGDPLIINQLLARILVADERIKTIGTTSQPFDVIYIYQTSGTNRVRKTLIGDYYPSEIERIIIESSVSVPVLIRRKQ